MKIKQIDRYWSLFPCLLYALFQMECSLNKMLQKCSLTQVRILYSLWNCTNCIKIRKTQQSGLGSKTKNLHAWNNYSKLALKYFIGVLPHGVPYSVWISEKFIKIIRKSCFWRSSDLVIWDSLKKTLTYSIKKNSEKLVSSFKWG